MKPKFISKHLSLFCLIGALSLPSFSNEGHETQVWLAGMYKAFKKDKVSLSLYTELRTRELLSDIGGIFAGPIMNYGMSKNIDLSLGAKYIYINAVPDKLHFLRFEPQLTLKGKYELISFDFRNRHENRLNTNENIWDFRSRHRLRVKWHIDGFEWIKNIYVHNEYFYNWTLSKYERNRLTPLGVTWNLNPLTLSTQYLIEMKPKKTTNHAIGLILGF